LVENLQIKEENSQYELMSLNSRTAIVLGCAGQDGSLISKSLLKKGYKVIGTTRSISSKIKNHIKLGIDKDIEIKHNDITNVSSLSKIIEHYQPESIFNLAAQSSVGKSFSDPIDTVSGIVIGTLNVLETCRKFNYKGRLFFASSSEIFGNNACGVDADCLKSPINTYGIAKKTSFELVKFYRELYNLKCVSGILFNHESHLRDKKFVIQKIIQGAKEISKNNRLKKLKVGNIEVIRDWGWAPEYMEGVQIMTSAKKLKDYVICSGIPISLKKFIEKVFSYYNLNWTDHVEIDKTLFRDSDIMVSYGDPTSINEELGWSAQISMDTIIKNMIELSE
tara:strand:- start:5879 stop:6886 length:1008 start_codon:yes stop_codon:yes gene_type:complete